MSERPGDAPPKLTLVTFGHVRPTHEGADGSTFELAAWLEQEGRLDRVIAYGFEAGASGLPPERCATPGRLVLALAARPFERAARFLPAAVRRWRERLFDWLVSVSPELRRAEVVVFRKPNFARSARVLRRRGIPSIAIASILHPRTNYERVRAEARRLGLDDRSPYSDRRRMRQLERFFGECDRILTSTGAGAASFREHGIPPARIASTPLMNGADCVRFAPRTGPRPAGPLRYLHLSSMNLIKGVGLLLEAWRELSLDDAELVLGGSMDASAARLFDRLAPPRCTRLGPVAEPPAAYRSADVFVSPSLSDSAPNTVLEALASGLPVIASDACGASALIEDGVNGFVYPWSSREALAERMRWCAENRERLPEMGRAARETALANPRGRFGEMLLRVVDDRLSGAR